MTAPARPRKRAIAGGAGDPQEFRGMVGGTGGVRDARRLRGRRRHAHPGGPAGSPRRRPAGSASPTRGRRTAAESATAVARATTAARMPGAGKRHAGPCPHQLPDPGSGVRRYGNAHVEVRRTDRRAIGERRESDRCVRGFAEAEVDVIAADRERVAQAAHHDAKRDVDDVIARPAAVREAREIAARNTERALLRGRWSRAIAVLRRIISDGVTFCLLVDARETGQERRDQVDPRQVRRREVRDVRPQRRIDRVAEQHVEQRRQRGIRHVGGELPVVARLAGIEAVLVGQSDHDFIDERVGEPRDLDPRPCRSPPGFHRPARWPCASRAARPWSSRRSRHCRGGSGTSSAARARSS